MRWLALLLFLSTAACSAATNPSGADDATEDSRGFAPGADDTESDPLPPADPPLHDASPHDAPPPDDAALTDALDGDDPAHTEQDGVTDAPADVPTESPPDAAADAPADTDDAPVDSGEDTATDATGDAPIDAADTPIDTEDDAIDDAPIDAEDDAPADAPSDAVADAPGVDPTLDCAALEALYLSLISNADHCNDATQCQPLYGHCGVGLGGCHYAANVSLTQEQLSLISERWVELSCDDGRPVCRCIAPPSVTCQDSACTLL